MLHLSLIQSMGWDAYATNLMVNHIENKEMKDGFRFENEDYTLVVSLINDYYTFNLKAYVPSMGWKESEMSLKQDYIDNLYNFVEM